MGNRESCSARDRCCGSSTRSAPADLTLKDKIFFVKKVPLFATMEPSDLPLVAGAFSLRLYEPGEVVVQQGDKGDELFVIRRGCARVLVTNDASQETIKVADLFVGDFFGEASLLYGKPRNATVEADDILEVMTLNRRAFDRMGLRTKLHFKRRVGVQGSTNEGEEGDSSPKSSRRARKSPNEKNLLKDILRNNPNLGPLLADVGDTEVESIVDKALSKSIKNGDVVIRQGDIVADRFYMVQDGTFDVLKHNPNVEESERVDAKVGELGPGTSFGELALLFREPRAATIKATSDAQLWVLNRSELKRVLMESDKKKVAKYGEILSKVELLKDATSDPHTRQLMASALVEASFKKDKYIIKQGEEGRSFFILFDGEVDVEVNDKVVGHMAAKSTEEAKCFGELALLKDEPRAASIKVSSESASLLVLDRATFEEVVRGTDQMKKVMKLPSHAVKYDLDTLKTLGVLGCGAFGKVTLVRDPQTSSTFALKALSKGFIVQQKQEECTVNEKEVLRMTNSAFLIKLYATFNRNDSLYFMLEPAMGGELFTVLFRENLHGKEAVARFYTACVMRGLIHLQERLVVYRDLKTENLLLSAKGYCKITDFGLAKFCVGHTFTMCGTPEYFAPEMVQQTGHTGAVDWWALGVLLYELMTGQTPFVDETMMRICKNIKAGLKSKHFDNEEPWTEVVKNLCTKDPGSRWGVLPETHKEMEQCAFFTKAKFNWEALDNCTMKAPFVPNVKNNEDISNFEDLGDVETPGACQYKDPGTGWDKDFENVFGPDMRQTLK